MKRHEDEVKPAPHGATRGRPGREPEAVEAAVLRLLKEGLVSIKAGSGPDDVLVPA